MKYRLFKAGKLALLFVVCMVAIFSIAAYAPVILGTANQVAITTTVTGTAVSLIGPYTPATYTQNGILFGNGISSIGALAELSNGQLAIGRTGSSPLPATLTAGVGIAITNASGSITIKALGNNCADRASAVTPITIATTDCLFLGSATAGADQIVNLPAATGTFNSYCIKKQDANAKNVGVTPNGTDTIDGVNAVDNILLRYAVKCYNDYASGTWAVL